VIASAEGTGDPKRSRVYHFVGKDLNSWPPKNLKSKTIQTCGRVIEAQQESNPGGGEEKKDKKHTHGRKKAPTSNTAFGPKTVEEEQYFECGERAGERGGFHTV